MAKRKTSESTVLYIAGLWDVLPDDAKRKGRSTPLEWGKFRSPGDSSESGLRYQMARQAIKADRDGFAILGVYDELLAHYGFGRSAALRGWLVNHRYQAASDAQLAQVIGMADLKLLRRAMRTLEGAGLLVRVARPDIEAAVRDDRTIRMPPDAPDRPNRQGTPVRAADEAGCDEQPEEAEPAGAGGQCPDSGQPAARPRPDSGQPVAGQRPDGGQPAAGPRPDGGQPAAGPGMENVRQETGDGQTPDDQTPMAASAAPSPPSAGGNGQTGDLKLPATAGGEPTLADGQARDGIPPAPVLPPPAAEPGDQATGDLEAGDRRLGDGQLGGGQTGDGSPASPAHPPPVAGPGEPTEADPGQGAARGGPEGFDPASAYVEGVDILARDIGKTLYPTREDLVIEGRKARPIQGPDEFERRELGALVVAWTGAMSLTGPGELLALQERAIKEAVAVRRKRTKKPKGACWRWWFNKHMEAAYGTSDWARALREARLSSGPP